MTRLSQLLTGTTLFLAALAACSSDSSDGVSYSALAGAACDHIMKCSLGEFSSEWGSKAECTADIEKQANRPKLPGENGTQAQVDACTAKLSAAPCAVSTDDILECRFKGTLANSAACSKNDQCAGGRCKTASNCGVCTNVSSEGGDCTGNDECVPGLRCVGLGVCTAPVAKDGACNYEDLPCAVGFQCIGGTCKEPSEKDGTCTPVGNECREGLVCIAGTCNEQTIKVAAVGEACGGQANTQCRKSSCRGPQGSQTCVALAKAGAACSNPDGTAPDCDDDSDCVNGTCVAPGTVACK